MSSNFTKIRKLSGWILIILSVILSIVALVVAYKEGCFTGGWSGFSWRTCGKGFGIYVASQVTWYPGLALLGPEAVQKSKDIWNNLKLKVRGLFK